MADTENLSVLRGESEVDKQLVEEASNEIKSILREHLGAASYKVVDYLLVTFFNNEEENLKKKKLVGHKSFQQLLVSIQDSTGKSKSWLYEAIKLWLDREKMKGCEAYMKLSISHRALLLKVPGIGEKTELAANFIKDKTSYKTAKELLRPSSPDTTYTTMSRLINHPGDFKDDELKKQINKTKIKNSYKNFTDEQQVAILKKADDRVKKLEDELVNKKELLDITKFVQKVLIAVSTEIGEQSKDK